MRGTAVAMLLGACAVAGVACSAASTSPEARLPGLIVSWSESPWPSIWVSRADGTRLRRILRNRQNAKRPRLSPDRRWVAFDGAPPGKLPLSDFDVQVVRLDGAGRRTLTRSDHWDIDAQWSPDGTELAFTRFPSHEPGLEGEIWVIGADGTGLRRIAAGAGARWSPDGRRLLFHAVTPPGKTTDLFVVDADGANRRRLTATPASEFAAGWSRRDRILFTRSPRNDVGSVYVMDVDGSSPRRVATGFADCWSPDGSKILYSPSPWPSPRLRVMDADGSHKRAVRVRGLEPDWR